MGTLLGPACTRLASANMGYSLLKASNARKAFRALTVTNLRTVSTVSDGDLAQDSGLALTGFCRVQANNVSKFFACALLCADARVSWMKIYLFSFQCLAAVALLLL